MIINFDNEKQAIKFMSECSEWNNQGIKKVVYNWASKEVDEETQENAVWFECPNDKIDDDGETLEEYLSRRADNILNADKEKYRVESGSVYEYDKEQKAYVFIGKLNGENFQEWIEDYENNYEEYNN